MPVQYIRIDLSLLLPAPRATGYGAAETDRRSAICSSPCCSKSTPPQTPNPLLKTHDFLSHLPPFHNLMLVVQAGVYRCWCSVLIVARGFVVAR